MKGCFLIGGDDVDSVITRTDDKEVNELDGTWGILCGITVGVIPFIIKEKKERKKKT